MRLFKYYAIILLAWSFTFGGNSMEKVEIIDNQISYQVHPYTELFGIMAILANSSCLYKNAGDECHNRNYRNEIIKWFTPLKKHKAILLLTQYTSDFSFNYDAPCGLFLELADNENGFSDYICKKRLPLQSIELNEFLKEIHNFILDSNFKKFYNMNKLRYRKSLESFIEKTIDYSPENYLFQFIGNKSDKLAINLMHSVCSSHYGLNTEKYLYVCVMPNGESNIQGEPDFAFNLPDITSLILHEFAHSFINPLTDKYKYIVNEMDNEMFGDALDLNPYGGDINTAINETVIRSIECCYIEETFPEIYQSFINNYIKSGFSQIPHTIRMLQKFQSNRDIYLSIDDFYSKLLNSFLTRK